MTNKIQFNAKSFKDTRNIMNGYFACLHDLAVELDKAKKATKSYSECIRTDREELIKLALGQTEGIVRTKADIELSLATNENNYKKLIAPYEALIKACEDAIEKGVNLFNDNKSALYKAYSAYVLNPSEETYYAYADAMVARFKELGLEDATRDNVQHYMVNADRPKKGQGAVKAGRLYDAMTSKMFSEALLRKFYENNQSAFKNDKFLAYVEKCKNDAKNK